MASQKILGSKLSLYFFINESPPANCKEIFSCAPIGLSKGIGEIFVFVFVSGLDFELRRSK